ncbi:NAD(P)(+) transhydrogenase (Re/Si-specific) subunit alpha [Carbonactinospora thermoautotrophica]|uniref:Re/Si-specific NAD(P)(+) transhydrogenase subunit alpha n=1 Tax=Carbonactinospora thermoautotrophica TaxID=1469144 RepID=UPI00226E3A42|nr:Re/Si-specific NAD(P)(+) transhydrogenase subunit alpha [Carbonactinospora thermoautotrophica]MCX9193561.1 NAD(P)(+) transhydrogenase (Re/Si-specific) subunit alpha [Carbonactinospora thermoautotrophica]
MAKVGVPAETRSGERRVALVPEVVPRLLDAGLEVYVQSGAGRHAYASDEDYRAAGAKIVDGDVLADSDIVLTVQPLEPAAARRLRPGATVIGFLAPSLELDTIRALRDREATAFALELVPRISRAQAMDALSSQALVAGYRAALVAAERLPKFFPLFMTAAGTVPPAKVLVLGAGVAGLQAIATARRLGAVVEAYDVRAAAAEEVRSLGARFIELELETQDGAGGYAKEQSAEFLRRQRELIGQHVAASDAVITTAAVPGRPAPLLVTTEMVERMQPGSVVVDLAAESGGNCELSRPGEEVVHRDVLIWGGRNVPSQLPVHASQLYAKNVANLLLHIIRDGEIRFDFDDEIVTGCCVTHAGEVRQESIRQLVEGR